MATVERSDDSVLGHPVDHPRAASVANTERALQQRDTPASFANHDLHGLVIQVVSIARLARSLATFCGTRCHLKVHQFLVVFGLLVAEELDHAIDFVVADERPLSATERTRTGSHVEHVAVTEQLVRSHLIQHDAAVHATGDLERNACGKVRLDESRDDIDRRLLRCQHKMDSDRARLLSESNDVTFHVLAGGHHHVGHFVGNDHDVWHGGGDQIGFVRVGVDVELPQHFVLAEFVVAVEMPHTAASQQVVTLFHFVHGPTENGFGLFHVGDDRVHQVRDAAVRRELDHLRVDHQHLHLIRTAAQQDRQDQRVETDALARSRPTGNQEVRHFGHIDDHRLATHVLTEEQRDRLRFKVGLAGLQQLLQTNHDTHVVGDFDSHRVLAGDR